MWNQGSPWSAPFNPSGGVPQQQNLMANAMIAAARMQFQQQQQNQMFPSQQYQNQQPYQQQQFQQQQYQQPQFEQQQRQPYQQQFMQQQQRFSSSPSIPMRQDSPDNRPNLSAPPPPPPPGQPPQKDPPPTTSRAMSSWKQAPPPPPSEPHPSQLSSNPSGSQGFRGRDGSFDRSHEADREHDDGFDRGGRFDRGRGRGADRGRGGPMIGRGGHVTQAVKADWLCSKCKANNFKHRETCFRCGLGRKESDGTPEPSKPESSMQKPELASRQPDPAPRQPEPPVKKPEAASQQSGWNCQQCGSFNFRDSCFKCKSRKPDSSPSPARNSSEPPKPEMNADSEWWHCSKCNSRNFKTRTTCHVCSRQTKQTDPKPSGSDQERPHDPAGRGRGGGSFRGGHGDAKFSEQERPFDPIGRGRGSERGRAFRGGADRGGFGRGRGLLGEWTPNQEATTSSQHDPAGRGRGFRGGSPNQEATTSSFRGRGRGFQSQTSSRWDNQEKSPAKQGSRWDRSEKDSDNPEAGREGFGGRETGKKERSQERAGRWDRSTPSSDEPSSQKSDQEKQFDEIFKKWEQGFDDWKKQNASNPDKQYVEQYIQKMESMRVGLLERRENLRKQRINANQPKQGVRDQPSGRFSQQPPPSANHPKQGVYDQPSGRFSQQPPPSANQPKQGVHDQPSGRFSQQPPQNANQPKQGVHDQPSGRFSQQPPPSANQPKQGVHDQPSGRFSQQPPPHKNNQPLQFNKSSDAEHSRQNVGECRKSMDMDLESDEEEAPNDAPSFLSTTKEKVDIPGLQESEGIPGIGEEKELTSNELTEKDLANISRIVGGLDGDESPEQPEKSDQSEKAPIQENTRPQWQTPASEPPPPGPSFGLSSRKPLSQQGISQEPSPSRIDRNKDAWNQSQQQQLNTWNNSGPSFSNRPPFDGEPTGFQSRPPFNNEQRRFNDGSQRPFNDPQRPFNNGPQRPFNDGPRPFNDGPQRPFNDGPQRPFNDGPQRPFNDGPRPFNDGPQRPFNDGPRPFNDGPQRPFNDGPRPFNDGPQRPFNDGPRPFNDGPQSPYNDGPQRPFFEGPRFAGDSNSRLPPPPDQLWQQYEDQQPQFERRSPVVIDYQQKQEQKGIGDYLVNYELEQQHKRLEEQRRKGPESAWQPANVIDYGAEELPPALGSTTEPFERRDMFERRGPDFERSGFQMRGPEFDRMGPGFERRGPEFERRGPDFNQWGPDRREDNVRRPDFQRRNADVESRDFEGRRPEMDRRSPGFDRRSPGLDRRSPGFDRRGPDSYRRGPDHDRRGPEFDRRGPNYDRRGPEFDRRGPDFDRRGPDHERRGPDFDRRGPFDRRGNSPRRDENLALDRRGGLDSRGRSRSPFSRRNDDDSRPHRDLDLRDRFESGQSARVDDQRTFCDRDYRDTRDRDTRGKDFRDIRDRDYRGQRDESRSDDRRRDNDRRGMDDRRQNDSRDRLRSSAEDAGRDFGRPTFPIIDPNIQQRAPSPLSSRLPLFPGANPTAPQQLPFNPPPPRGQTIPIDDLLQPPGRYIRPPKIAIILRGLPGSGKSFVAKNVKEQETSLGTEAPRILSLDDYFECDDEYEYEPELEESYRLSLIKSFKKQVDDGYFSFIVVDCINNKTSHYEEMCNYAKVKGFEVYIAELEGDVAQCTARNIHSRSEREIAELAQTWEETPMQYDRLDLRGFLQDKEIEDVEMGDASEDVVKADEEESQDNTSDPTAFKLSKWELSDKQDKMAQLDGVSAKAMKKLEHAHKSIEDWLDIPDNNAYRTAGADSGKKRVRWADLEEHNAQRKMRDVGFVVGQTDWRRMMDPTEGGSALTRTKIIPNRFQSN